MEPVLRTWFGDDVELSSSSLTSVMMYLDRSRWISGRTLQHILFTQNWSVKAAISSSGRSFLVFSQSEYTLDKPVADKKNDDSTSSLSGFLRSVFGSAAHSISDTIEPVGSTSLITIAPSHAVLRLDNNTLMRILDHRATFDVHIKHNKLVVMETVAAASPLSLAALLRQRRVKVVRNETRQKRTQRISKSLKRIARTRLSRVPRS